MNTRRRLLQGLTLGTLIFGAAVFLAERIPTAAAQEPAPRERQRGVATFFGMQTLAPGQTAQMSVVNPLEIIPCVRVRLVFDLYEADPTSPTRLRFVRSISREVELEPGEATSFDYTAGGRGAFVSAATLVREINEAGDPHVTPRIGAENSPGPIRTRATAATSTLAINERGRVVFTAPGVRVGFDPQPDPPAN